MEPRRWSATESDGIASVSGFRLFVVRPSPRGLLCWWSTRAGQPLYRGHSESCDWKLRAIQHLCPVEEEEEARRDDR